MDTPDHLSPRQRGENTPTMTGRSTSTFNAIKLKHLFYLAVEHWLWFVVSLLIAFGGAYYYLLTTPKIYTRTASILVKGAERENGSEDVLRELGMQTSSTNVSNEISSLTTNTIALEVVKRLHLEMNYFEPTPFQNLLVYGVQVPVTVTFADLDDHESVELKLNLKEDATVELSDIECNGKEIADRYTLTLGDSIQTTIGGIKVTRSPYYKQGLADRLVVRRLPFTKVANSMRNRLSIKLRDKNSTIIDLTYRDRSIARSEDILNTLVAIYNENGVRERNQRMVSANEFIKERLGVIEHELGNVENVISDYKSVNLMPDVSQAGSMAVSQASSAEQELRQLDDQIYMIRYIRNYLTDGLHESQLLPTNSGLSGSNLSSQIAEYNDVMLQRNNHLANSSQQNPLVIDLNQRLAHLQENIILSLDNEQNILKMRRSSIQSNKNQAVARIASNPNQEKFLLSVERQQKVKESLYLYLLQKREENELSQAFTTSGSRLIELPHGSYEPTEPVAKAVYLLALLLGLGIPSAILLVIELLNTTVCGRKDLELLQVPFAGEIPFKKRIRMSKPEPVVQDANLDLMNEAFRMVRTNVEFMLGFDQQPKVLMMVSFNPGAGKTFITANLATAFSLKNKRVIALDLDLRRARLSNYVDKPKRGISNYLSGQEPDFRPFIVSLGQLDLLPAGTFPPNPTELLFSPRFDQLIQELRQSYDYILIDCPPVELVADTKIISRCADMTLFVVRARLFEKGLLPTLEQWYEQKAYPNLAVVLNGTELNKSSYGYHHYGYYGHYGYGEKNKKK